MSFSSDSAASGVLNRLVQTLNNNYAVFTNPGAGTNSPQAPQATSNATPQDQARASQPQSPASPTSPSTPLNAFGRLKNWRKPRLGDDAPLSSSDNAIIQEELVGAEEPPEPMYLAHRIQALTDSLPPIPERDRAPKIPKQQKPLPPTRDAEGRPIPPPGSTPIKDKKLIKFLSTASVMNGSVSKGRRSVWSMLETLHSPQHGEDGDNGAGGDEDEYEDPTVMLYAPLIPTADSKVELASSQVVPVPSSGSPQKAEDAKQGWGNIWLWKGKGAAKNGAKARIKQQQVWVPSPTKLSIQTMWWGYRLYLPPPILDILNNKQLEVTKQAALITTALKWLLDNIPMSAVPPPLQPALLVLQRIVPYLGYIGGFIAWSWSTIKSYDTGHGVILTATWVLPVALIPSTWRPQDVAPNPNQPVSPTPPPSAPAPPSGTTPSPSTPSAPGGTDTSPAPILSNPPAAADAKQKRKYKAKIF